MHTMFENTVYKDISDGIKTALWKNSSYIPLEYGKKRY